MNNKRLIFEIVAAAEDSNLNTERLTEKYLLLYGALKSYMPRIPDESLLLALNSKLSQAASLHRPRVIAGSDEALCNVYTMLFMPSGMGKDYPPHFIDKHFMGPYFDSFKAMAASYKAQRDDQVKLEAETKYDTKSRIEQHLERHSARFLVPEMSDATPEGFYDYRLELQRAQFGGSFVKIDEFGDYISSSGSTASKGNFLTAITEVYEEGSSSPKVIKYERDQRPIKNVPNTAMLHTSLAGVMGFNKSKIINYLNQGAARRCFVGYVDRIRTESSWEDALAAVKESKQKRNISYGEAIISNLVDGLFKIKEGVNTDLYLSDDANALYQAYEAYNILRGNTIKAGDEGVLAVVSSLHRKMLKFAGIIAALESPGDKYVNIEHIKHAIYQSEFFYNQFKRFYEYESSTEVEALISKLEGGDLSRTDIRSLNIVSKDNFVAWIDDSIEALRLEAERRGYSLEIKDQNDGVGRPGKVYSLVSLDD